MSNVYDVLVERDFVQQTTNEQAIRDKLANEKVHFYIGFDATADSLHVGHFLQLIVMRHMQQHGHIPVVLIGGGTTMVGDPTGKTDMRKMLTREQIDYNAERFKEQISKFIDFSDGKAIMVNNADWLTNLNYIDFLREVGTHFSVNQMLTAECFKTRLEKGLSFIEFNYMLMQSYDFYVLNEKYGCTMELGGNDQWANILGGIDLIRRKKGEEVYGMTFTLLTNSEGKKMGKTENGAVWLDPNKTSPYDFYQYWRNVADADVKKCLKLLTFLPMDEVNRLGDLKDAGINEAKRVLAYEVTKLVHGEEEAAKAQKAAEALFGGGGNMENVPSYEVEEDVLNAGISILDLLTGSGLTPSKSEARRAVQQGGVQINGEKVEDIARVVGKDDMGDDGILVKRGKKNFMKIVVKQ